MLTVSIYIEIQDADTLCAFAERRFREEGYGEDTVREILDRGDVGDIARLLIDPGSLPGCKILDSSAVCHDRTNPSNRN